MSRKSLASNTQPLFILAESFYPETWRDDTRMGVLLAEFRARSVNQENYDSKMKFWKEMILNYCEHKGSGSVSILELKRVFKRKGTSPYCLQAVFDDMLREGQLLAKDVFWRTPQESWSGWAVDALFKKPLGWGFGKMKEKLVGNQQDETVEFICIEVVKKQTDILEKLLQAEDKHNKLISLDDLLKLTKKLGMTEDGVDLVLHHMVCKQRVFVEKLASESENKRVLLKFATPGAKALQITDIERSIYNLEQTEQELLKVVEKLEENISDAMTLVRENIREGKKQVAKSNLRKKYLLEKNLEKKMNVLDNVQTMLSRIHDSQNDLNVIDAYKHGANALKNAFANSGITLDSVDDTLAEMKEIMEQQDEMQTMISTPQNVDIDDLELEQELSDLIDMKLAENNIIVPPVPLPTTSVTPAIPGVPTPNSGTGMPTLAQLNDFDKEIEKRLAALKMDVSSPVLNTTITKSAPPSKQDEPATPIL